MSSQSSLDRFKEIQITGKEFFWLLVGAFAGLILGLVIGWVLWPVEWQGGDVGALSQAAQVEYLDTVADAYAGDPSAAQLDVARQRLQPLTDDLSTLFEAAIAQAREQSDNAAQTANLTALASALGVAVENLPMPAPEAQAAPTTTASGGDEGGGSSVNLFFLGALLFVVGGAGLWWAYQQGWFGSRNSSSQATGQSARSPDQTRASSLSSSLSLSPSPSSSSSLSPSSSPAQSASPSSSPATRTSPSSYSAVQAAATKVTPVQPPTTVDVHPFDPDEPAVSSAPLQRVNIQPIAPSLSVPSSTTGRFIDDDTEGDEPDEYEDTALLAPAAGKERTAAAAPNWMAGAGRLERYPTIDRFETTYTMGMEHFDRTKNIPGPQEDVYLGEYGIGISERHGILNNDPDQVVAIEVYVFDKSDESHPVNVGRVVLSEYADSHLRKHFEREKDRLGPIVAQPNTTLQLEARQFVLICTITDVAYTTEGIFQRVAMQMELKKKI